MVIFCPLTFKNSTLMGCIPIFMEYFLAMSLNEELE